MTPRPRPKRGRVHFFESQADVIRRLNKAVADSVSASEHRMRRGQKLGKDAKPARKRPHE